MKSFKTFSIYAATDIGRMRSSNGDNFLIVLGNKSYKSEKIIEKDNILIIVTDGMGGHRAGEVASNIAVQTVVEFFKTKKNNLSTIINNNDETIKTLLQEAIFYANKKILEAQQKDWAKKGMETTIVVVWIIKNKVYTAWVGDSRIYIYLHRSKLKQISKDHSLVQELIDKGVIKTEEEIRNFPQRNVITKSLGYQKLKINDIDTKIYYLNNCDKLLLCSDGLNSMINDSEIERIISQNQEPKIIAQQLIDTANQAGGEDNITVIVVEIINSKLEKQCHKLYNQSTIPQRRIWRTDTILTLLIGLIIGFIIGFTYPFLGKI